MFYGNLKLAREAFQRGKSVTSFLKEQFADDHNTPEIMEIAYALQTGSYVDIVKSHRALWDAYTHEIADTLGRHCIESDTILDVVTGEMTTLAGVANHCYSGDPDYFACDISWGGLNEGKSFITEELSERISCELQPFVADLFSLPFVDSAVDVVWTSHALEPNGGKEKEALSELLRVARKKLILFEPCYEENSSEGKERMDILGYIKGISAVIKELGGTCKEIIKISNISNPLNPTYAFIIHPQTTKTLEPSGKLWACPAHANLCLVSKIVSGVNIQCLHIQS